MQKKLRIFSIFLLAFFLFAAAAAVASPVLEQLASGSTIVYITRTGSKYHRGHCSYLKSKIEITLKEAKERGYTPCSRCDPPQ